MTTPLPQDLEAERLVLSCILQRPEILWEPDLDLRASDFYRPSHGELFDLIVSLLQDKTPIDPVSVSERVHRQPTAGTVTDVLALFDFSPSSQSWTYYSKRVRDLAEKRELYRHLEAQLGSILDPNTTARDIHAKALTGLQSVTPASRVETVGQVAAKVIIATDERQQGKSPTGTRTGFRDLDEKLVGFDPGALVVLAARPGVGKSALALELSYRVAVAGRAVLFVSLEMGREQIVQRLLSSMARVRLQRIRIGDLNEYEWASLIKAQEQLAIVPLHIDDKPRRTVADIASMARRVRNGTHPLGLVVIDYLQLMQPDDIRAPREQQIATISRGLKVLSAEVGAPVLALAQLNRESEKRANRRPILSDLRESGALEQDAEVVLFLYRDPEDTACDYADVLIEKHRNGETGSVKLGWDGQFTRFDDYRPDL